MGHESQANDASAATHGDGDQAALEAENASLQDRLLRLAVAENARRRGVQRADPARRRAIADVMVEMLPILDNLQRASAAAGEQMVEPIGSASVTEGVRATIAMRGTALERFGVRKVENLGAAFDPLLHDAIMEQDQSSEPTGTIVGVMVEGYTIGDQLLRPARVIVAGRSSNPGTKSNSAEPRPASTNDAAHGRQ